MAKAWLLITPNFVWPCPLSSGQKEPLKICRNWLLSSPHGPEQSNLLKTLNYPQTAVRLRFQPLPASADPLNPPLLLKITEGQPGATLKRTSYDTYGASQVAHW